MHYASFFHAILQWFNNEYWSVSWPNIFAPSVWTLFGIAVADVRNEIRHRNQKLHHNNNQATIADLAGQIESLSDKLSSLIGGNGDTDE